MSDFLKRSLATVGGIALFVAVVLLYNAGLWLSEGAPTIPQLESRWWAGYYETTLFGKQWCVARFIKSAPQELQMALLSGSGAPQFFDVDRNSSNQSFVYLTFTDNEQKPPIRIEAKQLYLGKRYYFGRLIVGRFHDFWKMNDEIAIRGNIASSSSQHEFAIEPISDERLEEFWRTYVRPNAPSPSPAEMLKASGRL